MSWNCPNCERSISDDQILHDCPKVSHQVAKPPQHPHKASLSTGVAAEFDHCLHCGEMFHKSQIHTCPEEPGGYMVESATMPWMCPHCHNHIPAEHNSHICKLSTELVIKPGSVEEPTKVAFPGLPDHRDSSKHVGRDELTRRRPLSSDSPAIQQIIDAVQCMLLIKYLTQEEGEAVMIINDNPDPCPNDQQSSINWSTDFDVHSQQFWGKDTLDCLKQAEDMKRST